MTILRRQWLLSAAHAACRASANRLAATLAGAALLVSGPALAAPHSHARRPLPTPLHATSLMATTPRAKKHSGTSASRPGAHSHGSSPRSGAAAHDSGKPSRRGRKHRSEPVEDAIPMYRAGHEPGRRGHEQAYAGHTLHPGRFGSFASGPAPLVSSAHGHLRVAQPSHATGVAYSARRAAAASPAPSEAGPRRSSAEGKRPLTTSDFLNAAGARNTAAVAPAQDRSEALVEGVSHPDDTPVETTSATPVRALRTPSSPAPASPVLHVVEASPAPIVRANPGPHLGAGGSSSQPQVVQGFGGEVAVASPAPAPRPGGTRRRNHPVTWAAPEPQNTAPALQLEEREAITEAAVSPAVLPEIYHNGRLVMPAPLKGSHDVLVHQNQMAANEGLARIQDDADLDRLRATRQLVSFPASASLRINEDLPANRRYARPWTVLFAADIAQAFYTRFHQPLQVNSAVRTVSYQARLQLVNGNAAATAGEAASPHLTGQAIDLGKRGMSTAELAWMRAYLLPLMRSGKIDVEEEFQQACFHISVYRVYVAGRRPAHELAQLHPAAADSDEHEKEVQ